MKRLGVISLLLGSTSVIGFVNGNSPLKKYHAPQRDRSDIWTPFMTPQTSEHSSSPDAQGTGQVSEGVVDSGSSYVTEAASSNNGMHDHVQYSQDPSILPVVLQDDVIFVDGVPLMVGVSSSISQVSKKDSLGIRYPDDRGLMLSVDMTAKKGDDADNVSGPARARHDILIGNMKTNKILACSRIKRWWMAPSWPIQAGQVPIETQFMLVELPNKRYAVLLPLVDGSFRATLYGAAERKPMPRQLAGRIWEGIGDALSIRVESGDRNVRATSVENALFIAGATDPYALLRFAFREVARRLGTFGVREDKPTPPLLKRFGWCTWDAFYSNVRPEGVMRGLEALAAGGTPAKFLILDDGWQSVGPPGSPESKYDVAEKAFENVEIDQVSGDTKDVCDENAMSLEDIPLTEAEIRSTAGTTLTGNVAVTSIDSNNSPFTNLLQRLVGKFYSRYVEHAESDSWTVQLWKFVVHRTFIRYRFLEFFHKFTDFSKRLTSFRANKKFEQLGSGGRSFKGFVEDVKCKHGIDLVYCWHAMPGYWGGVSLESNETAYLQPFWHKPDPTPFVKEMEPSMLWDPAFLGGVGACRVERSYEMYRGIHAYLQESGVDGVKVDAQSGLGSLAGGIGGGPKLVRQFTESLESSVVQSFGPQHCINCMCHSTENLYNYKYTAMARVSDDFYPKDLPSQTWHIAAVACNSLFIGEITHADWDMFHSVHPAAAMHAAARAVGGCSVYTSDAPGKHDFELLRRLTLPDGAVPVAKRPGHPTLDCLFKDPTRGGAAFKIFNENHIGGSVVAAFNLQGSAWDRKRRMYAFFEDVKERAGEMKQELKDSLTDDSITTFSGGRSRKIARAKIGPTDFWSEGKKLARYRNSELPFTAQKYAAWTHLGRFLHLLSNNDKLTMELEALQFEIVTLMPTVQIALSSSHLDSSMVQQTSILWAPLGLSNMMNTGGTLLAHEWAGKNEFDKVAQPWATVTCMGPGEFVSYSSRRPMNVYIRANGKTNNGELIFEHRGDETLKKDDKSPLLLEKEIAFVYEPTSGLLSIDINAVGQHEIRVLWQ